MHQLTLFATAGTRSPLLKGPGISQSADVPSAIISIPRSAQYDWLISNTCRVTMVAKIRGDVKSEVMSINSIQSLLLLITVHHL